MWLEWGWEPGVCGWSGVKMFIIQEPCDRLSTPPPPGGGPLALITGLRQSHLGLHPRVVCVMCV